MAKQNQAAATAAMLADAAGATGAPATAGDGAAVGVAAGGGAADGSAGSGAGDSGAAPQGDGAQDTGVVEMAAQVVPCILARVLVDGRFGKVNAVITVTQDELAAGAGELDAHPAAVAYAKSL
ncbi:hypothetical protein [Cupriavidus sp. WS]|uniref:hypothetical protein n=1 Tax=Cupriavidus sp. WS TaxID=1312922 RepID=UPI00037FFBB2|nr:hypothetical protein [Cupriavidus sp. WS]